MKNISKLVGLMMITVIVLAGCSAKDTANDLYETAKEVTLESIPESQDGTNLYYFYQEDCSHCQNIKDDVTDFYNNKSEEIKFYLVDMADEANFELWESVEADLSKYGLKDLSIQGTPTLVDVKDGVIDTIEVGEDSILDFLDTL